MKASMRILMLAPEPFLEPRGTPFSVYHRIKALVSLGYEVDLITYPIGKQVVLPGLKVYRVPAFPFIHTVKIGPSWAKLPLDLSVFFMAGWLLYRNRYRYLHTHEEAGIMGVLLATISGCKHLYDMHSDLSQQMLNFSCTKSKVVIALMKALQKLVVCKADAVITICPDLEYTARQLAPQTPIYMIENVAVDEALPVADEYAVGRLRQKWQLNGKPVLLYTGTLESYQGIELLLRSAVQVSLACPDARYLLVGGQPEQIEKYRQLARELGISSIVHFVGQRPLEEMPTYMALATILLSPRSEGTNTPLKLYTYLRSGKAILATNIFSHTQILTPRTALLVPPTAEGLAQGTLTLLNDTQLAQSLGKQAQRLAGEHYSWDIFLEKMRQTYNEFTGQQTLPAQESPHIAVSALVRGSVESSPHTVEKSRNTL